MTAKQIVYFDLETQRSFRDVKNDKSKMGISVAVTYNTLRGSYQIYRESELDDLSAELVAADLVVGWNHLQFDYPVLQPYVFPNLAEQTLNLDMMLNIHASIGSYLKLDVVASSTLGAGKSGDGLDALKWWKEYKKSNDSEYFLKIAEYCCYDVKVTRLVHEFAVANGYLLYTDKTSGNIAKVEVNW